MTAKPSLKTLLIAGLSALALAACSSGGEAEPEAAGSETAPAAETEAAPKTNADILAEVAAGEWRTGSARDEWRHPVDTLLFFGVEPDDTVIEYWPGGGWYTEILGPYLKTGGGTLVAAGFDPVGSEYRANAVQRYADTYVSKPDIYGNIEVTVLSAESGPLVEPGTADVVLTFRNVHNWMSGGFAEKAFADAYEALKPGGILGVVEHRLPSSEVQDPTASTGYVHEDYVVALATEAGFELVEKSEINANPADTADHPFGVWTLPPASRQPNADNPVEGFDPATYAAIGESDRMTLKFRKPPAPEESPGE